MPQEIPTALRVTQLDCNELDDYLQDLLQTQFGECLHYVKSDTLKALKPELNALIHGALLYWSVHRYKQTVGQSLFGVRYRSPMKYAFILYQLSNVLLVWWKLRQANPQMFMFVEKLEKVIQPALNVIELLNFLRFVRLGDFNSVICRVLGLRMEMESGEFPPHEMSYTFIGREILWHRIAESMFYLVTVLNFNKTLQVMKRALFKDTHSQLDMGGNTSCELCSGSICQAHSCSCEHFFCYHCLYLAAASNSKCPLCNTQFNIDDLKSCVIK